jgi:hypothetical protein
MAAFALLYFIKRNDRVRNKLAEITHIKGLSTNYYQVGAERCEMIRRLCLFPKDLCRQRMQEQPTGRKSPEVHQIHSAATAVPTTVSAGSHGKHNSEGSSTRSSTSSWWESIWKTSLSHLFEIGLKNLWHRWTWTSWLDTSFSYVVLFVASIREAKCVYFVVLHGRSSARSTSSRSGMARSVCRWVERRARIMCTCPDRIECQQEPLHRLRSM